VCWNVLTHQNLFFYKLYIYTFVIYYSDSSELVSDIYRTLFYISFWCNICIGPSLLYLKAGHRVKISLYHYKSKEYYIKRSKMRVYLLFAFLLSLLLSLVGAVPENRMGAVPQFQEKIFNFDDTHKEEACKFVYRRLSFGGNLKGSSLFFNHSFLSTISKKLRNKTIFSYESMQYYLR